MKKIISGIVVFVVFIIAAAVNVSAHSTDDTEYSHTVGVTHWDVYNNYHWLSYLTPLTVNCGDFKGAEFESYINNAVVSWNNATFNGKDLLSMKIDNTNGSVVFLSKTDAEIRAVKKVSAWAFVYQTKATVNSSGHYSTNAGNIEIWVNWNESVVKKSNNAKTHVPLHELGHVIGLMDIPASVSPNGYLMCNGFGAVYSAPTTITKEDMQGAAYITGQHASHSSFGYTYENLSSHKKYCTVCGAYKYESHTYDTSNGLCRCGYKILLKDLENAEDTVVCILN